MRTLVEGGYALAEAARWVDGRLVYVDILAGALYELPGPRRLAQLDVPLGAVAPTGDGWIAAAGQGIALLGPDGTLTGLDRLEPETSRMNDGCCDPHGRFWAGSTAYDGTPGAGSLYCVEAGQAVQCLPGAGAAVRDDGGARAVRPGAGVRGGAVHADRRDAPPALSYAASP